MKKRFTFLIITFLNFLNAQESHYKSDLQVSLKKVFYNFSRFGAKEIYGEDVDNPETLYTIFFYIQIEGFDIDNPIDFNNFSLVENDLKIRQRPFRITFSKWELKKINLKDFHFEDNFLKYNQVGITNYDHYFIEMVGFKKNVSFQQRFPPLRIPPKENKKGEFVLQFSVKSKKSGDFSLFYKDKLVKNFILVRDKVLKFKD